VGDFKLANDIGLAAVISSRRGRALLGYLACAPNFSASRERLCGLLWSDPGEAQARSSLRQCILEIRTALAPLGLNLVNANREEVAFDQVAFVTDMAALETAIFSSSALA
jgi:DNA-binding SARP family transcriptional activator